MKNPASIPLSAPPNLTIQIPTDQVIQEDRRQQEDRCQKEDRRQQALERLRVQNRALPQETRVCPSVPRSAGWEALSKKN